MVRCHAVRGKDGKDCTGMPRLLPPLLALIANSTESELAKCVDYLRLESRTLRARLPTANPWVPARGESDRSGV